MAFEDDIAKRGESGWGGSADAFWASLDFGGQNGVPAKPPPIPSRFNVTINRAETAYEFYMEDDASPAPRPYRSSYNIYFLGINAATPAQMSNKNGPQDAFKLASIIASAAAPAKGGAVQITSDSTFGQDGWFFCTAYSSRYLLESLPNGPVRSPIVQNDLNTAIPPNVASPSIALTDILINDQPVAKLDFQAVVPAENIGVFAVTITVAGSGYTTAPTVTFADPTSDGVTATGIAVIESGAVTGITITEAGSGYLEAPAIVFTGGGGTLAAATASIGQVTIFSGYQLYIENYNSNSSKVESTSVARNQTLQAGAILSGTLYLLPDAAPASTNFYFVSLSPSGARTTDIASAPVFNFPGGIT